MDSTAVISGSIQVACRDLDLPIPSNETARHVIGLGLEQALSFAVPSLTDSQRPALAGALSASFLIAR